ncbi:MAG TPA: T9SS type A sorting domain-containing protein [Candidatus Cloacimonas sp.]|nr:T9SS type A sorting domain-containing protein [Candidatus Cloacimonas sp.]
MKKSLIVLLIVLTMSGFLFAAEYTIVDGSSNSYHIPVNGNSNYGWSRFIFTATEMSNVGITGSFTIYSIAFKINNDVSDYTMDNQKIYFGYNYNSTLSGSTSYPNPGSSSSFTKVYDGSITFNGPGWMEIIITTPFNFTWDGYAGLDVVWENWDGSKISSGYPKFYYTSKSNMAVYKESGTGTSFPTSAGTTSNNHPSFKIITPPTSIPNPAINPDPVNGASGVAIEKELKWASGGGSPINYIVNLGTDNPPTNIAYNEVVTATKYTPANRFDYGTIYYWQVIPHNIIGDAQDCPIWSFTTMDDPSIATFPYQESFDTAVPPNSDWLMRTGALQDPITLSPTSIWEQDDWLNIPGTDKAARINIWGTINGWLITPIFNIPDDSYYLSFDLAVLKYNQTPTGTPPVYAPDDRFAVLIGDGYSWSTANIVREWNNTGSPYVYNDIRISGEKVVIPLTGHSGHCRFAFYAGSTISNADSDVMINNIEVAAFSNLPLAAQNPIPENNAQDVPLNAKLFWDAGGNAPVSYNLYLGQTLPGTPVECLSPHYTPAALAYGTTYSWKVVPVNPIGEAIDCPVWNFTTTGTATVGAGTVTINDVPINPSVEISGLEGETLISASASFAPEGIGLPNAGLVIQLSSSGVNLTGKHITINHSLGFVPSQIAYRILPSETYHIISNPGTWTAETVSFILEAKADGDVDIVFPLDAESTLPVELSYFNAIYTAENYVTISWVSQSETNHSGYNILRSEDRIFANAIRINPVLIDKGTELGTQIKYKFIDSEFAPNTVYYYWLESISLNGETQYFGPVFVMTGENDSEPETPELPIITKLYNAYPNPFNPNTVISYSVSKPATVTLEIYNSKGQKIRSFINNHNSAGIYSMNWDGKDDTGKTVSSGVYIYRMKTDNFQQSKKMLLTK